MPHDPAPDPVAADAGALRIAVLDHRRPEVARQVHAVLEPAHAQELRLLRPGRPVPAVRPVQAVQDSADLHLGAFVDGRLAGVLAIGADDEPQQLAITVLVVDPPWQRRGIARRLLAEAVRRCAGVTLGVSTGAANAPALALYRGAGFCSYRQGLGPDAVAMLKLRRRPQAQTVGPAADDEPLP